MPESFVITLANSSPVAKRSVGFCEGVSTRCRPSAATAAPGAAALRANAQNITNARVRAIIGGERTSEKAVGGGKVGGGGGGGGDKSPEPPEGNRAQGADLVSRG